jgi:hypothetical protein
MNAKNDLIQYNVSGQGYYSDQYIKPDPLCNGWTAINRGDGLAYINGIPLSPSPVPGTAGESITIGGNLGEIWGGDLQLSFDKTATVFNVVVIQKFYLPGQIKM